MKLYLTLCISYFLVTTNVFAQTESIRDLINENHDYVEDLYKHLHANPELSFQEEKTSKQLAGELNQLGFSVTEGVGGYGIVAVLENGDGPVVLVRSDMDALPIKEETGASFSSNKIRIDSDGNETPVAHACGHDMHMAVMIGTGRVLTQLKSQWKGTLVMIAQPAEELGIGSQAMIEDGLFERFPQPDYALALHVNSAMASGDVGYTPEYAYANVDGARIIVKGRGGHGAYPDLTIDPIVIASKLVVDLQTIISREMAALEPAVLSVGAFNGGNRSNIIPNEVELQLTMRTFSDETRTKLINRIREMGNGAGLAAGLPEDQWPELIIDDDPLPSVYNDPVLAERLATAFKNILGEEHVFKKTPVMYGEDFGRYGRTEHEIPIFLYGIGAISPEEIKAGEKGLIDIPSTHSSKFLPDTEPTLKTGILTMSNSVLELLSAD